ncbi:metabotropic glutamate receptor [Plakobranchus ocellatus]|uniref:Metabotropic glutamate receptor n=1 Tax=Plakobranchus ocellatus TaxID=259542 RepID=A0AAV4BTJ6_9GAST|nr:metabotropic glutamate receptor [Plakobranchus ocellatus]
MASKDVSKHHVELLKRGPSFILLRIIVVSTMACETLVSSQSGFQTTPPAVLSLSRGPHSATPSSADTSSNVSSLTTSDTIADEDKDFSCRQSNVSVATEERNGTSFNNTRSLSHGASSAAAMGGRSDPSGLAQLPDLSMFSYSSEGDITIGALVSTHWYGPSGCQPVTSSGPLLVTEAISYAVSAVNSDPNILPGVKLGFAQVNICSHPNMALARALNFLPRIKVVSENGLEENGGPGCNLSKKGFDRDASVFDDNNDNVDTYLNNAPMPHFDVIGVIGPSTSAATVGVSRLLGSAHIPVMGVTSTSDELSDKGHHPYFLRVVAPDKYQVEAMLRFITEHRWSYVSVVYLEGSYGEAAFAHIKTLSTDLGVCIATSHRSVASINATGHFIWLASDGWKPHSRSAMKGLEIETLGTFSFDYQSNPVPEFYKHVAEVMLADDPTINYFAQGNDERPEDDDIYFNDTKSTSCYAINTQRGSAAMIRSWRERAWELVMKCDQDEIGATGEVCIGRKNATVKSILSKFESSPTFSLYVDAVWTFALATHDLIRNLCPGVTGQKVRKCIQGDILLSYLKNVSFNGSSGVVMFTQTGDAVGRYIVSQVEMGPRQDPLNLGVDGYHDIGLNAKTVAYYDIHKRTMGFTETPISWDHLKKIETLTERTNQRKCENHEGEEYNDNGYLNNDSGEGCFLNYDPDFPDPQGGSVPESVCSKPCKPGQFLIQREPAPCCWECRACRDNERLVRGNTSCELCAPFTWPDPETGYQTCAMIPVTYSRISELLPTLQIFLGVLALIILLIIVLCYVYFRETRVIKAASRELSILQMAATFLGFITVIIFQVAPGPLVCGALYFLFCLSFALLYCPLLVKAVRIYRIFDSTSKSTRRPKFVSPTSQVAMTMCLVLIQVLLCLFVFLVYRPTAQKIQPTRSEKRVELSCDMTLPGLTSFLAYNLVLVLLCSVFAFKTRKLPDNFNESNFICMCVSTTLVIWLAFVPTYFASKRGHVRVLLLSLALLLNHSVALVFLFAPKIYAAAFVADENFQVTRFQANRSFMSRSGSVLPHVGASAGQAVPIAGTFSSSYHSSNRIAPMPEELSPRQSF